VVPEYEKLKNQYELLWDVKDNEGYLQLCAIMQKFLIRLGFILNQWYHGRFSPTTKFLRT